MWATRCALVPARPNMRSKVTRGLISMGSGVVAFAHDSVFM
jgi:hypothetical protein